MECRGVSGQARIDPIVNPGVTATHAHEIFGSGGKFAACLLTILEGEANGVMCRLRRDCLLRVSHRCQLHFVRCHRGQVCLLDPYSLLQGRLYWRIHGGRQRWWHACVSSKPLPFFTCAVLVCFGIALWWAPQFPACAPACRACQSVPGRQAGRTRPFYRSMRIRDFALHVLQSMIETDVTQQILLPQRCPLWQRDHSGFPSGFPNDCW
jgi:hypothetical protein